MDRYPPAFPFPDAQGPAHGAETGMTLRDYFAAKAVPALLALCINDTHKRASYEQHVAANAYAVADAMLKAREA